MTWIGRQLAFPAAARAGRFLEHLSRRFSFGHMKDTKEEILTDVFGRQVLGSVWQVWAGLNFVNRCNHKPLGRHLQIRHQSQSDTLVRNQAHSPAASSRHHDIMLAQQGDQVHGALAATFQSKSSNAALSRASATSEFWTRCEDSLRVVGTRAVPIRASISRIPDFVVPIKVPD